MRVYFCRRAIDEPASVLLADLTRSGHRARCDARAVGATSPERGNHAVRVGSADVGGRGGVLPGSDRGSRCRGGRRGVAIECARSERWRRPRLVFARPEHEESRKDHGSECAHGAKVEHLGACVPLWNTVLLEARPRAEALRASSTPCGSPRSCRPFSSRSPSCSRRAIGVRASLLPNPFRSRPPCRPPLRPRPRRLPSCAPASSPRAALLPRIS